MTENNHSWAALLQRARAAEKYMRPERRLPPLWTDFHRVRRTVGGRPFRWVHRTFHPEPGWDASSPIRLSQLLRRDGRNNWDRASLGLYVLPAASPDVAAVRATAQLCDVLSYAYGPEQDVPRRYARKIIEALLDGDPITAGHRLVGYHQTAMEDGVVTVQEILERLERVATQKEWS